MTRGWKFQILLSRKQGGEWLLGRQQMSTTITFGVCFPLGHNWQWDSVPVSGSFPSRFWFPCHPGQLSSCFRTFRWTHCQGDLGLNSCSVTRSSVTWEGTFSHCAAHNSWQLISSNDFRRRRGTNMECADTQSS